MSSRPARRTAEAEANSTRIAQILRNGDRLQGDSKIGAGDVAFFEKLVYRAIDSGDWNGHCAATAESVGVNAEHLAFHADKRSTGESRIKLEIKANALINPAAGPGSPLPAEAANDAGASD